MSGETAFAELIDPQAPEFDALLRIYDEAIPAAERKPPTAIRAMAISPDHRVEVAIRTAEVTGFALTYVGQAIDLLEYLAVDSSRRGAGMGAALFERVRHPPKPLLVEVESDRPPSDERTLRARRINFYRRFGCRRLQHVSFVLPLTSSAEAPSLDLLVSGWPGSHVPRASLREWIEEIYERVYGQARGDPRISMMLRGLPTAIALE